MFALCSKTYVLQGEKGFKLSCKSVNKKAIRNPKDVMERVLQTQYSKISTKILELKITICLPIHIKE